MSGSRLKVLSLVLVAALASLVLLAWSQPWFHVTTVDGDLTGEYDVAGDMVAGALAPLSVASFALVLALAIAGPGFRIILGVLEALLGVTVVVVTVNTLADPIASFSTVITEHTGNAGEQNIRDLVTGVDHTAWPTVALVAGALTVLLGLAISITGSRWPKSGRKYSRSRLEAADRTNPVDEWDALSEGDDPTEAGPPDPDRRPR